jgi:dihydrofolate synthase/folylpolyglutamate synthase
MFTSPHLVAFGERIQVNREPIAEGEVARLVAELRSLVERGWDVAACAGQAPSPAPETPTPALGTPGPAVAEHPTFFEVVTVMALKYFVERRCDLVIWETGLGGRLDATNIVTPLASVITNIQFDHQKWLGETLASIASEKAGIIKPRIPVITGTAPGEALAVIEQTARGQQSPLTTVPATAAQRPPLDTVPLPLLGQHQRMNAAVAVATVQALVPRMPVAEEKIRAGLARVHWPGRLQVIGSQLGDCQMILLDGAHNVAGAEILATALKEYFPLVKPALVLGILRDKDWPAMCEILAPRAKRILLVPVPSERTAEPHGLAEACRRANPTVEVGEYPSLAAALLDASKFPFIAIAGSLYLVGEAMELLHLSTRTGVDERGLNEWSVPTRSAPMAPPAGR